jgi:hypothetical protein
MGLSRAGEYLQFEPAQMILSTTVMKTLNKSWQKSEYVYLVQMRGAITLSQGENTTSHEDLARTP